MKKILFILSILVLFVNSSLAYRALTKEEHYNYLKSLGLNEAKIAELEKIESSHYKNYDNAVKDIRKHYETHPNLTKEEYAKYNRKVKAEVQKQYEKDLDKILNFWQKKSYFEYKSRVY